MIEIRVGSLVLDFSLYPRASGVNSQNISSMREALDAGARFPPIVACRRTLRVSDGFHRTKMYTGRFGPDHLVMVDDREYATDAELLLDAVRLNASHGQRLGAYDRIHVAILAERLSISPAETAAALHISVPKIGVLRATRVATVDGATPHQIPLKRILKHLNGTVLTQPQQAAHLRLGGMDQRFHADQLILLIESGLLEVSNGDLIGRLRRLADLIAQI